jgi:Ca2+/H+ antiporter
MSMQQTVVEVAPAPEQHEEEEEEEEVGSRCSLFSSRFDSRSICSIMIDGAVQNEFKDMTPGQIWFKAMYTLFAGLGIVGIFSDPMCDVLSAMTNTDYTGSLGNHIPINPFFVSFIVTPICSNASELISSLAFAAKKTKKSISMT